MTSFICTLFEGHYHFGVAALVNSLFLQGFRGTIYAGYRGALPAWAKNIEPFSSSWLGSCRMPIGEESQLVFLPLSTTHHLTNFKPDFMLALWESLGQNVEAAFYFDPDIVVSTPWPVFEDWVKCGVALCEDVNSPLAKHHPTRTAWRNYFGDKSFALQFKEAIYANGGFVGVAHNNKSFLCTWKSVQEAMAAAIGGLNKSSFSAAAPLPFAPFGKTDQDALNATVEAWKGVVSFVGKEGMAFDGTGAPLMSHALGPLKPWLWKPLKQVFGGKPPRLSDKHYWQMANGAIKSQPDQLIRKRKLALQAASVIGRFYSRN